MNSEIGNDFKNRVQSLVEDSGVEPFVWAKRIGIPSATFNRIWNEGSIPKSEHLITISEKCGISIDWLLKGADGPTEPNSKAVKATPSLAMPDGFSLIPRYAVEASAGNGRLAVDEVETERLAFKTEWLHEMGLSPRQCSLITAAGDSMNPTIPDGALLLVDMDPDQKIRSGCLYVVILDGDLLVKRIMRRTDGTVELISDNSIYPKEVIQASDLASMQIPGRVVWVGHAI